AGKRLASDKTWWGDEGDEDDESPETSVIHCFRGDDDQWSVRIVNAVGLIAIGDLHLEIRPKIPLDHLVYLFAQSRSLPRVDPKQLRAAAGKSFWDLVARWYLSEAERLLRYDLIRDYQETNDWTSVVRGRMDIPQTARALLKLRPEAFCQFEEF